MNATTKLVGVVSSRKAFVKCPAQIGSGCGKGVWCDSTHGPLRARSQRRERVLHDFLELSNRLRVTSEPQTVLEEVALAVQGV